MARQLGLELRVAVEDLIAVDVHRPELKRVELHAVQAHHAPAMEHRARRVEPHGQGHQQHQGRDRDQAGDGQRVVEDELEHLVDAGQADLLDVDQRHIAELFDLQARGDDLVQARGQTQVDLARVRVALEDLEHAVARGDGAGRQHDLADAVLLDDLVEVIGRAERGQVVEQDGAGRHLLVDEAHELEARTVRVQELLGQEAAFLIGADDHRRGEEVPNPSSRVGHAAHGEAPNPDEDEREHPGQHEPTAGDHEFRDEEAQEDERQKAKGRPAQHEIVLARAAEQIGPAIQADEGKDDQP